MNILNLLSELANARPNSQEIDDIIKDQPSNIQSAVKSNNGEELKQLMSHNQFYANETTVTLY
jgi:hypothetical protein